jgi:hypothetical protein
LLAVMPTEAEVEAAFNQLNARIQEFEQRLAASQEERENLAQEVERLRAVGTPVGAAAGGPARAKGLVDTRLIGKPQGYDGDASRFADWAFVLKAYMSALDPRYQDAFTEIETSEVPVLNATLTEEDVSLSTQLYYVLVMLCTGPALNKCYNAGVTEGFESWRQFVLQWEPKLASRFVGLLMQLLTFQFEGDLSHKVSQFDRLIAAYETQAKKKVDDDIKVGVAIIGMRDAKVKEHLVRNAARLGTWASMSAEVIEISRTQEYLNSTPAPMQLGALPDKKAKGKAKAKAKGKGKGGQDAKKPSSNPSDKDRECFYCKKKGHVKADCRARQRDLAAAEGRGGGKNSKKQLAAAPTSEQPQAQQAPVQQQTLQQPQQVYMAPTMPMVQYPGGQTGPYPVSAMTIAPAPDQGFLLAMPLCASADAGSSARALENAESTLQLTRVAPLAAESVAGEKKHC